MSVPGNSSAMLAHVKRAGWLAMRALRLDAVYLLAVSSPPALDGWIRSYREGRSVDREGNPIPWLTYPAIELLSRRVHEDLTVFEYGSGASTHWWASRARSVDAVEHDAEWYRRSVRQLPPNARVDHVPLEPSGRYARHVLEVGRTFDVIVIDGRERNACARLVPDALSRGGVVVFDNTDRPQYAEGIRALLDRGFRRIEFVGMIPISAVKSETSIFYREGNCFDI